MASNNHQNAETLRSHSPGRRKKNKGLSTFSRLLRILLAIVSCVSGAGLIFGFAAMYQRMVDHGVFAELCFNGGGAGKMASTQELKNGQNLHKDPIVEEKPAHGHKDQSLSSTPAEKNVSPFKDQAAVKITMSSPPTPTVSPPSELGKLTGSNPPHEIMRWEETSNTRKSSEEPEEENSTLRRRLRRSSFLPSSQSAQKFQKSFHLPSSPLLQLFAGVASGHHLPPVTLLTSVKNTKQYRQTMTGFKEKLEISGDSDNPQTSIATTLAAQGLKIPCVAQALQLSLLFTVSVTSLNMVAFPAGWLLDYLGPKLTGAGASATVEFRN